MIKRMKHDKHGFTHAYTQEQEAALRLQGWTHEAEILEQKAESLNVIQIKKKGGRPRKVA